MKKKKYNSREIFGEIKVWTAVLIAAIFQSLGVYVFIQPNNFSPGGLMGVATFIEYLTGFNTGYSFFLMNLPLLVLAFFYFKKSFLIKTIVTIVLNSALLALFPAINVPQFVVTPDQGYCFILAAVAGGITCGSALALLVKTDGCNGGTEIIGSILQQKFPATNIAWFIFMLDSSVIFLSAFKYDAVMYPNFLVPILLSMCKMFCSSKMCESILRGFTSAIKFEVVTMYPDELGHELTEKLGRGVTILRGKGAYSGADKGVLMCVIRKRQIAPFKRILKEYPDTFAYMLTTTEVFGQGFSALIAAKSKENEEGKK